VGVARDLCPNEAEDFDGDRDDDGCFDPPAPKQKTTALVALQMSGTEGTVKFARVPRWSTVSSEMLASNDEVLLLALAKELRIHRDWTALVAVPATSAKEADQLLAKKRAERIVRQLKRLTLRDNSAQAIELASSPHKDPVPQAPVVITLRSQASRIPLVSPEPQSDSPEVAPNNPSPKVVP
jgi:hypothetical protein